VNDRRAEIRAELSEFLDNDRSIIDSAVAPIVFVAVNAFVGLGWAVVAAGAIGLAVLARRITTRGQPGYAIGGLLATIGAALLALWLGRAEGFFLPGILANAGYAAVGVVSIVARRPLVAWASAFTRRWPRDWYWRNDVRPAYTMVTWFWVAFWAIRGGSQLALFRAEQPEVLAGVKILMGWPMGIPLVILSYVYGTWRLGSLGGPSVEEHRAGTDPPWEGQRSGF
jgi:hypothetical protein